MTAGRGHRRGITSKWCIYNVLCRSQAGQRKTKQTLQLGPYIMERSVLTDRKHTIQMWIHTRRSYEYILPVPFLFATRCLFVCEGGALGVMITAASTSSLNPRYLPWPSSSSRFGLRWIFSLRYPPHIWVVSAASNRNAQQSNPRAAMRLYLSQCIVL